MLIWQYVHMPEQKKPAIDRLRAFFKVIIAGGSGDLLS